jgi:hypothetical protein
VARAIAKRGGLPARPFLSPAFEVESPKFLKAAREVFAKSGRKLEVV